MRKLTESQIATSEQWNCRIWRLSNQTGVSWRILKPDFHSLCLSPEKFSCVRIRKTIWTQNFCTWSVKLCHLPKQVLIEGFWGVKRMFKNFDGQKFRQRWAKCMEWKSDLIFIAHWKISSTFRMNSHASDHNLHERTDHLWERYLDEQLCLLFERTWLYSDCFSSLNDTFVMIVAVDNSGCLKLKQENYFNLGDISE